MMKRIPDLAFLGNFPDLGEAATVSIMYVSWLGLSSFKIETKDTVVVTDPYSPQVGAKPLRAKADIVTISSTSESAHNHTDAIQGSPFIIDHPGEFEVHEIYIQGISLNDSDNKTPNGMIYIFDIEGMRIAHFGDIRSTPSNSVLEKMGVINILFIPVGGGGITISPQQAVSVINEVEPGLVIPMHYAQKGLKIKEKLAPVSEFLKVMGSENVEPASRMRIREKDLPQEEVRVLLFEG